MAILEISAVRAITTYECGDAGRGVPLEVAPIAGVNEIETGWVGLWFGPRMVGEFPGEAEAKELGIEREVIAEKKRLTIQQALSEVGEANHWSTVTLNGNCIWICEALKKAREELKKAKAEAKKKAKEDAEKEAEKA
ncbi:MAG: hypothetical protein UFN42_09960 [Collinsella sp.]|jgi:hypothetical protein|nr:hypothetical protein [Collinsella sp.]